MLFCVSVPAMGEGQHDLDARQPVARRDLQRDAGAVVLDLRGLTFDGATNPRGARFEELIQRRPITSHSKLPSPLPVVVHVSHVHTRPLADRFEVRGYRSSNTRPPSRSWRLPETLLERAAAGGQPLRS